MADKPWRTFRHKEDHSVTYEVRDTEDGGYEIRRHLAGKVIGPGPVDKEEFDKVYEPVPEESENREDISPAGPSSTTRGA